jgi:transposase
MERRRRHGREFKLEAVRLVRERGVTVAQAALDLDIHPNLLRSWIKPFESDPQDAFPAQGRMKPEQAEIERLRREVQKLKARWSASEVRFGRRPHVKRDRKSETSGVRASSPAMTTERLDATEKRVNGRKSLSDRVTQ